MVAGLPLHATAAAVVMAVALSACQPAPPFDLIVRGGSVFDGTGVLAQRLDIGIKGDRIAAFADLSAEKARLEKELAKAEADIKRVDAKLSNEKFVANAPEEIVEEEKEKRDAAGARKAKILEALELLKKAA